MFQSHHFLERSSCSLKNHQCLIGFKYKQQTDSFKYSLESIKIFSRLSLRYHHLYNFTKIISQLYQVHLIIKFFIIQIQMSEQKPKREFLKKGSRQFLSNAQVKRQPYKVVDFRFSEDNSMDQIKVVPQRIPQKQVERQPEKKESRVVRDQKDSQPPPRVPIHTRPKKVQQSSSQDIRQIPKWNPQQNEDQIFEVRGNKARGSAKPPVQQGNSYRQQSQQDDNGINMYLNKKRNNKQQSNTKKQHQRGDSSQKYSQQGHYEVKNNNYTRNLPKTYQQEDQYPIQTKKYSRQQYKYSRMAPEQPKQQNYEQYQNQEEQYEFNDEQQLNTNQHKMTFSSVQQSNKQKKNVSQTIEQGDLQIKKQPHKLPARSSVVENYFMKDSKNNTSTSQAKSSKMRISDIPEDLKIQIIDEAMKNVRQKFQKDVQKLKILQKNNVVLKNRHQQQIRQVQKLKKKLEDQHQQKKQEFEEYMKKQKAKISKDQKVIKDNLQNRYTRKERQQIQDYKKEIQQIKQEKKKSEVKLRNQIERLKKRLDEQIQRTRQLQDQVKIYQLDRIKQKQKQKTSAKTQVQAFKRTTNKAVSAYVFTAGPDPYITQMKKPDFALNTLPIQSYNYENNIYYQQYKKFPRDCEMQYQKTEGLKIMRFYKDGRVQCQVQNDQVKQQFPNGYKIVHWLRGHIKQWFPEGVTAYYDSDSNATEFTISRNKKIYYFHGVQQAQLKIEMGNKNIHQIYNGKHFRRK